MIEHPILESNGVIANKNRYTITVNNKEQRTTKLNFELLHYLMKHEQRIVTRDELLTYVWENDFVGERTIDVHIRNLRALIGKDKIITIKKVGYIWNSN
jgi:DNA-binding response OmpR family regulator